MQLLKFRDEIKKTPAYSGFILLLFSLLMYFFIRGPENFFNISNFASFFKNYVPLMLLSMAQALLMFMGYLDISIGAQFSMANVLCVNLTHALGLPTVFAWMLAIVCTIVLAGINGLVVSYLRIPSLLQSYGMIFVIRGINLSIQAKPGGVVDPAINKAYERMWFSFLPTSLLILFIMLGMWFIFKRTALSTHMFAVGAHERNAFASGINTVRTKVYVYMLAGFLVGIAGACYTAAYSTGNPIAGEIYGLQSISACIIGGIPMSGGAGTIFSALFGIGFQLLVKDSVVQIFKLLPGTYTTYWHNLFSDLIILLGLFLSIFLVWRQNKMKERRRNAKMLSGRREA